MAEKLKVICQLSPSERKVMRAFDANDITIVCGSAGCGKTFAAVASAFTFAIKNGVRICISRPVIEAAGERLGHLPGGVHEKFEPWAAPIFDCLPAVVSNVKLASGMIDILPLAYARGRTVNGAFLLDEAQNCSWQMLVLAVTRIGRGGKVLLTGDPFQADTGRADFSRFMNVVDGVEGVAIVEMDDRDQMRNPVVSRILGRLAEAAEADDSEYEDRV